VNYHHSSDAALTLCAELNDLGIKAHPLPADVSDPRQVDQMVAETLTHFGKIDILVNNVGPYVDTPFLELPVADFDRVLAGNLRSTFLMTQAVGKRMKAQGRGQIINIAASDFKYRGHSVYGLAKTGVIHFTEAVALELAPEVRINALAPDLIADNEEMPLDLSTQAITATPAGRLVNRAEIAEMVCLLCTPVFAMTTGQTILMDGGRTLPKLPKGNYAEI
jgi:NAD(P)-dependent dehydrogenase (short-subunit alcohol dehydrogenase family)